MADFLVEEFSLFSFFRCVLCICIFAFFCVKAKAQEDNPHHYLYISFPSEYMRTEKNLISLYINVL